MTMSVVRVDQTSFDSQDRVGNEQGVRRVVAAATEADGRSPLNEPALLSLQMAGLSGLSLWAAIASESPRSALAGLALVDAVPPPIDGTHPLPEAPGDDDDTLVAVDVNVVVSPDHRGHGVGFALVREVLAVFPHARLSAWSHGNHPAAARLASTFDFERVRDLWMMRLSLRDELPPVRTDGATVIRAFEPDRDVEAFLLLNAAAFATHPEQGNLSLNDLELRMAQPWFDPTGFFLAESVESGELLGFHWTKVHAGTPACGEVYVVGVSPTAQGRRLGSALTLTGLHHLRSRGLDEVILYVEADNAPAIALYARLGFTHAGEDTDVRYVRPPRQGVC